VTPEQEADLREWRELRAALAATLARAKCHSRRQRITDQIARLDAKIATLTQPRKDAP
jgi:hypothetical protein